MYADQENSVWTAHPHLLAEKNTYVEFISVCLFLLFLKGGFDFFSLLEVQMKTVRKALSSEDEGRQIFRQNQQNYRHRGINSWQEKSLPIGWFSGCKESSRLHDTESWLYLMNLITCLICGPSGERKFLLDQIFTVTMRRWLDLEAC